MKEHLRAIIWPRNQDGDTGLSKDGTKVYRYAIVGMLVTDRKLELVNTNEVLVDGEVRLGEQLETIFQRITKTGRAGDATNVLLSLQDL